MTGVEELDLSEVEALEARLDHEFADRSLLATALTHRSWANERGFEATYERLEFLGDAVLALLVAERLYDQEPEASEGTLSRRKSFAVSEPVLARYAAELGLGEALRLGVGEERSGGREKPSLLADAFEAVLGAVFLDGGLPPARRMVGGLLAAAAERHGRHPVADAKSRLQEAVQAEGAEPPAYELVSEEGPDHDKTFTVECRVRGELVATGAGRSKKIAEQRAAAAALEAVRTRSG